MYSPKKFKEEFFDFCQDDYINVINISDKNNETNYQLDYIGNIVEMKPIKYYSLSMDQIKKCAVRQLEDGFPIWFGCDTKVCFNRKNGLIDLGLFNFDSILPLPRRFDKELLLTYQLSRMSHAMVFTGVRTKNHLPECWKVENSYGVDAGKNGYFMMTDEWFEQYVYQVVIEKKYLSAELKKMNMYETKRLAPWSPVSTLAMVT